MREAYGDFRKSWRMLQIGIGKKKEKLSSPKLLCILNAFWKITSKKKFFLTLYKETRTRVWREELQWKRVTYFYVSLLKWGLKYLWMQTSLQKSSNELMLVEYSCLGKRKKWLTSILNLKFSPWQKSCRRIILLGKNAPRSDKQKFEVIYVWDCSACTLEDSTHSSG